MSTDLAVDITGSKSRRQITREMLVARKERKAVKSRKRIQKIDPKAKKRRKCNEPSYSQRKMSKEKKS